jgi:polyisoprenoid-binding protein YceI
MVTAIAGEYRFGPECGRLILKTTRAGLAAKAGHDLTIEVTRWSAQTCVPGEDQGGLASATLSAEADLGSLTTREGAGGAMPLTEKDRDEIDSTARRILAGRGNATATFKSSQIRVLPDGGEIEGTITINDMAQPLRLRVTEQGPGHYQGTGTVVQSAHGIKPYSAFLGTLKLQDEVKLEFEADLTKARPVQE